MTVLETVPLEYVLVQLLSILIATSLLALYVFSCDLLLKINDQGVKVFLAVVDA